MTRIQFTAALIAITVSLSMVTAAQAQWGNLSGRFVLEGTAPMPKKVAVTKDVEVCGKHPLMDEGLIVDSTGGIANAVIYVRTKGVKVNPDYEKTATETLKYDNKDCRFEPHVMTIRLTQKLLLHNSDSISHNSNLQPIRDQAVNPIIPAMGQSEFQFHISQTIPVPITCNIHPWMKGYILPRDNPYAAVSAKDGKFELKNLPVGKLEFQVWQEKAAFPDVPPKLAKGRFEMEIKAGDNTTGDIKLPIAVFNK